MGVRTRKRRSDLRERVLTPKNSWARGYLNFGSAQEFDGARILGRFPENHEFGFECRHALSLQ